MLGISACSSTVCLELSGEVKHASEPAHVENVKLPLLPCVKSPELGAV